MMKKIATLFCAAALLAAVPAMAGKIPVGQPAPDFTLNDIDGKAFQLSTFKDKKAVVINIMQSSCSSCKDELKLMNGLKSDKFEFVVINVDARSAAPGWIDNARAYQKEIEVAVRMIADQQFSVGKMFGIFATPATIVIGKDGNLKAEIVVIGNDTMVIPRSAPNPRLAHEFLNFMLDEEAGYTNFAEWNAYQPPFTSIDPARLVADGVVPPSLERAVVTQEMFATGYIQTELPPDADQIWADEWARIQTGD